MKTSKILALFFVLTFLSSASLRAEWFDGDVQKIDAKAQTLTISEIDPITDAEEKKEILVDGATQFSGVKSLAEIRVDDDVTIEARYDEAEDVWKAVSIEVAEAGA